MTDPELRQDLLTGEIIGAAIEVHRLVGPGLLESVYEACLGHELEQREVSFQRQCAVSLRFKDLVIPNALRIDLLVEGSVIVEIKAVEQISKLHESQLLTYLRLSGLKRGLILNFNVSLMKEGIRRVSNNYKPEEE